MLLSFQKRDDATNSLDSRCPLGFNEDTLNKDHPYQQTQEPAYIINCDQSTNIVSFACQKCYKLLYQPNMFNTN